MCVSEREDRRLLGETHSKQLLLSTWKYERKRDQAQPRDYDGDDDENGRGSIDCLWLLSPPPLPPASCMCEGEMRERERAGAGVERLQNSTPGPRLILGSPCVHSGYMLPCEHETREPGESEDFSAL